MVQNNEELNESIITGLIDATHQSRDIYKPTLLLNDPKTGHKVLTTLLKEFNLCDGFNVGVAFLTKSGITALINTLLELQERGVKGNILVSQYLNFTQPEALKSLLQFDNITTKILTVGNFHSKGYIFKNKDNVNIILGSSNLTANAMSTNTELNIKLTATQKSLISIQMHDEFEKQFEHATMVDAEFISSYEKIYKEAREKQTQAHLIRNQPFPAVIKPNSMQREALENLHDLRTNSIKRALIISATGTGKTYLAALDAKQFDAKKILFVVHRKNIAKKAMEAFKSIFNDNRTYGIYSGKNRETEADFLFCTVQTIARPENLTLFSKDQFDYIIIDETHRAGADTYNRILEYFEPNFLLGMTATPERTDGFDIFKIFEHNIAYEIRLHDAMEAKLLCPFHYFGVTDLSVDGEVLEEKSDFNLLISEERVNRIIENIGLYGCDDGELRGLIFCSRKKECIELSNLFNQKGFKTLALTGDNTEDERETAIMQLETDDLELKLDYIFTVDIFNEGIDIPRINQIIMLRPTQSAIIFVQQLGRGLRRIKEKEYLTVIDFIGNYQNSYLVPIALYGDTSFNKDTIRKLMAHGSALIPGSSTINFDKVSKERIFDSINSSNLSKKTTLVNDYKLLKFKIGRAPMMVDFLEQGARDPQSYVSTYKSYYNFAVTQEPNSHQTLDLKCKKLLELFAKEINNAKRIEETLILSQLIETGECDLENIKHLIRNNYEYEPTDETLTSALHNLNFQFVTERKNGQTLSSGEIYNLQIVSNVSQKLTAGTTLKAAMKNPAFLNFLKDNIQYAIMSFNNIFEPELYNKGFIRYQKYSRKDVFRVLNWTQNPNAQNVGGYMVSKDEANCAIFVNYVKEENISETTNYDDYFVNHEEFSWMSKSNRYMTSREIKLMKDNGNLHIPLFVKKKNLEGLDFYYLGDMRPDMNSFQETQLKGSPLVKVLFKLDKPVNNIIYDYITDTL